MYNKLVDLGFHKLSLGAFLRYLIVNSLIDFLTSENSNIINIQDYLEGCSVKNVKRFMH